MIDRLFDDITSKDIQTLVENRVPEGRTLDYKQELPATTDPDKKDFLKDVTAFANTAGGDLIYGVVEDEDENGRNNGLPKTVAGLAVNNVDNEIVRLENFVRDTIHPRLRVRIKAFDGFENGPVVIVRVPQSLSAPHMVAIGKSRYFYGRADRSSYLLDIDEIRSAFIASDAVADRIQNFRVDRLSKIIGNETPIILPLAPKVVVHILPLASFSRQMTLDIAEFARKQNNQDIPLLYNSATERRFNLDGYLVMANAATGHTRSYLQIFRSGVLEAVVANISAVNEKTKILPDIALEKSIRHVIPTYLDLIRQSAIDPPIFLAISLLGFQGHRIFIRHPFFYDEVPPIDRNTIVLPATIIESYDQLTDEIVRPSFDMIWQAAGYSRSQNFDENGKWRERNNR